MRILRPSDTLHSAYVVVTGVSDFANVTSVDVFVLVDGVLYTGGGALPTATVEDTGDAALVIGHLPLNVFQVGDQLQVYWSVNGRNGLDEDVTARWLEETFTVSGFPADALPDAPAGSVGPPNGVAVVGSSVAVATINAGAIVNSTFADETLTAAKFGFDTGLRPLQSGSVVNGGTTSQVRLNAGPSVDNASFIGCWFLVESVNTGQWGTQVRRIIAYANANKTVTLDSPLPYTPNSGARYAILPQSLVRLYDAGEQVGRPSTLEGMIRREFELTSGANKQVRDRSSSPFTIRLYSTDGATVLESWTQSSGASIDTTSQGA